MGIPRRRPDPDHKGVGGKGYLDSEGESLDAEVRVAQALPVEVAGVEPGVLAVQLEAAVRRLDGSVRRNGVRAVDASVEDLLQRPEIHRRHWGT